PDREDRADDQTDDRGDHAGTESEPVEEADAEGVADGSAQDDDGGVVPEERDRGQHDADDEPDDPRQDGREKALTEDVLAPLRTGHEAEEERPQGQQDREQLEPVEGPGQPDANGQQADEDPFDGHERPPSEWALAAGHRQMRSGRPSGADYTAGCKRNGRVFERGGVS